MSNNPYVLLSPLLDRSGDVILDDSDKEIEGRLYSDILAKFFEGVKQNFNVIERLYDNGDESSSEILDYIEDNVKDSESENLISSGEYSTKKILDSKGRPIVTNGKFDYIFIEGWYY